MDSIKNFLREVSTYDVSNGLNGSYSYNGIGLDGTTSSAFQKRLNSLYEEAIYRDGRKISVNVPKTRELMQKKEKERKNPKRKR